MLVKHFILFDLQRAYLRKASLPITIKTAQFIWV